MDETSKGGPLTTSVVQVTVAKSAWPAHVFAPYYDVSLFDPRPDLNQVAGQYGIHYLNLAFLNGSGGSNPQPAWGGEPTYTIGSWFDSAYVTTAINTMRSAGGDVMVSFGGATADQQGKELAQEIYALSSLSPEQKLSALVNAYQTAINAYGLTHIDFDIEGVALQQTAVNALRNQAIVQLEANAAAAGKTLDIWVTVPTLPSGPTQEANAFLTSTVNAGVTLTGVNIMTMDYGPSYPANDDPDTGGAGTQMGTYNINAAYGLYAKLQTLYPNLTPTQRWSMVGMTPMIGQNDVPNNILFFPGAQKTANFAKGLPVAPGNVQNDPIGYLGEWSLNRDRQGPNGKQINVPAHYGWSGLLQSLYQFSTIFKNAMNKVKR